MGWVGGAKISASFLRRIKLLRFLSRIVPLFLLPHHQNFGDLELVAGQKVKKAKHLGLLGVINRATGNLELACAKICFFVSGLNCSSTCVQPVNPEGDGLVAAPPGWGSGEGHMPACTKGTPSRFPTILQIRHAPPTLSLLNREWAGL